MMRARETFALRILNSIHGWMEEEQFAQRWKKKLFDTHLWRDE